MAMMHDDPVKEAEHQAAMNLVRDGEVTHRAIKSGAWSSPSTWQNGKVPGEGAVVLVPAGTKVTYDVNSPVDIFKVRIDGHLAFATAKDTRLDVDTMLVTEVGTLEIGSDAAPITNNASALIQFADNGAINYAPWDPGQLHRGLVSHGTVEIKGEYKTSFVKVGQNPTAGSNKIVLGQAPTNWEVGDQIVLTGTKFKNTATEDEVRTITGINGNTITLDKGLTFNHSTPAADLKPYVANLTRNVVFNSESKAVDERGHVMFMHSDKIDVENAAFNDLGRTNKAIPLDDKLPGMSNAAPGSIDNPRGRYSVHVHRVGDEEDGSPALIKGSVVAGSPGWGFTSHDSNANFIDNVAYDVVGAGFAAETGNETGTWDGNLAVKMTGRKAYTNNTAAEAIGDGGYKGHGFWLAGRLVDVTDNVAAGSFFSAFEWTSRGSGLINAQTSNLDYPAIGRYYDTIDPRLPALGTVEGNEAFAARAGLTLHRQFLAQGHDERSHIKDFIAWDVMQGVKVTYSTSYLLEDFRIYGSSFKGLDKKVGVWLMRNSESVTLRDVDIHNTPLGVDFDRSFTPDYLVPKDPALANDHQYFFVDVGFIGVGTKFGSKFSSQFDKISSEAALKIGQLDLVLNDKSLFIPWAVGSYFRRFEVEGTKYDSLGKVDFPAANEKIEFDYADITQALKKGGFYTMADGTRVIELAIVYSDRGTAATKVEKTLAVFDKAWQMPSDAVYKGAWKAKADVYVPTTILKQGAGATSKVGAAEPSMDHSHSPVPAPPTPAPSGPASDDYDLMVSFAANRSNAQSLEGATLEDDAYIFLGAGMAGIAKVVFSLDGKSVRTEKEAPYDFSGGTVQLAKAFDTDTVKDGQHTIAAAVHFTDGTKTTISDSFFVDNIL